jgi:hypothetical protein
VGGGIVFAAFPPSHSFSPTIASRAATSKSYKRMVFLEKCMKARFGLLSVIRYYYHHVFG